MYIKYQYAPVTTPRALRKREIWRAGGFTSHNLILVALTNAARFRASPFKKAALLATFQFTR